MRSKAVPSPLLRSVRVRVRDDCLDVKVIDEVFPIGLLESFGQVGP